MSGKFVFALFASVALAAFAHEAHEHDRVHDHEGHGHGEAHAHSEVGYEHFGRGVEVSVEAAELIGLTTVRAEKRVLDASLVAPARVMIDPRAARTLAARVSGFVTFAKTAPSAIEKGEVLCEIVSPSASVRYAELTALEARYAAVSAAGAKNAQLATDLAVLRGGFAAVTNGLEVLSLAEGRFAQKCGFDGRLDSLAVASGAYVEVGASLATMSVASAPVVVALVSVAEAKGLADGLSVAVADAKGTLVVDRTRTDGLVSLRGEFAAASEYPFAVGESVELEISRPSAKSEVVAVPAKALFRDGLAMAVLARDEHDADRFEVRHVYAGVSANGWTEVGGIEVGAEVAVDGLYELRQALPGKGETRAAGHFHADGKFHEGGHDGE